MTLIDAYMLRGSIDRGAAKSTGTPGEEILNLKGQIHSLLLEEPVIICFIIPLFYSKKKNDYFNWNLISSTLGLITKNTYI